MLQCHLHCFVDGPAYWGVTPVGRWGELYGCAGVGWCIGSDWGVVPGWGEGFEGRLGLEEEVLGGRRMGDLKAQDSRLVIIRNNT